MPPIDTLTKKKVITLYASQVGMILATLVCAALPFFIDFSPIEGWRAIVGLLAGSVVLKLYMQQSLCFFDIYAVSILILIVQTISLCGYFFIMLYSGEAQADLFQEEEEAPPHDEKLPVNFYLNLGLGLIGKEFLDTIRKKIAELRVAIREETGFEFPLIHVVDNSTLEPMDYKFEQIIYSDGLPYSPDSHHVEGTLEKADEDGASKLLESVQKVVENYCNEERK